jgi:hypothetical protein
MKSPVERSPGDAYQAAIKHLLKTFVTTFTSNSEVLLQVV